jgi:hypothetical protein
MSRYLNLTAPSITITITYPDKILSLGFDFFLRLAWLLWRSIEIGMAQYVRPRAEP